jgi:hypothetical protein
VDLFQPCNLGVLANLGSPPDDLPVAEAEGWSSFARQA